MEIRGLDELQKQLQELSDKAQALSGERSVTISELLNPSFITAHTRFATADDFLNASGFKIESQEDFEAIPEDKFDEFIRANSNFSSWQEMLQEAAADYYAKELGLS